MQNPNRQFTAAFKNNNFRNVIEKLTSDKILDTNEKSYVLACALLFLKEYENDKRYKSFADFAYFLILKYSVFYKDYKPLYDFSTNFGFYPITKIILENNLLETTGINDELIQIGLDNFQNIDEKYYETLEQNKNKNLFLEDQTNEKSYLAPTSFGKSSIIIDYIKRLENKERIAIIVPTKSLLMQTYKMIKGANLNYKLLFHDEMYEKEKSFIAIFTQERALRLLKKQKKIFYDVLIIDEAHKILESVKDKSNRSVLLSRLISLNKNLNSNHKVIYLSPLIEDVENIKIYENQNIKNYRINFNIKEPELFEYKLNGDVIKHNRFFINNNFEGFLTDNITNYFKYLISNSGEKNFIYHARPIKVEEIAKDFCKNLEKTTDLVNIKIIIDILKKEVHKDFYVIDYLEYGLLYIHGQMPDLIKEYLEKKYKELDEIKYLVANSVILEGINMPIDTLFIFNTYGLGGKGLTNLIGRVNRLNEIFKDNKDKLYKLLPKIHFINTKEYNSTENKISNMLPIIKSLRSSVFKDEVKNPLLLNYDIESIKNKDSNEQERLRESKRKIQEQERFLNTIPENKFEKLKQYLIESGIINLYKCEIDELTKMILLKLDLKNQWEDIEILEKIYSIFIEDNLDIISDNEFKRFEYKETRNHYKFYITVNQKRSLKENIEDLLRYFIEKAKSPIKKERMFYFGTAYGREVYDQINSPKGSKVYIDLRTVEKENELINLAIVKLKMEDNFISFTLNKFIVFLYDYDLISEDIYNLYVYGTTEKNKIKFTKFGMNVSLVSKLDLDNQLKNIELDKNNNIKVNLLFKEYLKSLNDFQRFEIERFIN
ncbi:DNA helicase [Flavobacterium aquariorum]|uniref:DNA helicase n=1 Tax=Flavobacterium aquariorum TaxID=2217670 RepID=A0A2W7TYH4_9FLAO|nr:DEAD/DEAH box helicase [Flavobacterium aquariorum]PZX94564.1 DNA helicase [Flavobacterium aquariorum]